MEQNYYSVTTDIGNRKMNEAAFSETKVQLHEIAVGDGGGEPYNPTTDMRELKGEQWRGLVSKLTIDKNIATVETVIPSEVGGFTIRELAVFDIDGTMIAIGNTPETPKVSNEEGIINEMKLQMEFSLINTDVLELKTDPNILTATKADVEELRELLENPEFDDTGITEGISSFKDFVDSVKNKMNIFQFFRNFKAGLKFIVHTGMIVDNFATKEKGFLPDATLVTELKEQLDEQNKNISGIFKSDNNTVADADNCIPGFNAINNTSTSNSHYTSGWSSILHLTNAGDGYNQQLLFPWSKSKKMAYRVKENNTWNDWSELVTNSDLANLSTSINNTLSFEVVGKMVFINGYVTGLSITPEGVNIGSLPSGVPIPKNTIRENCNVGANAYDVGSQGYFTISDTGTITVKCASGKTASAFYVSCSYVGK